VNYISSLDVHPLGDHLIIGSYDKRVSWFDLNLGERPYKTLRYHEKSVRDVAFHRGGVKLFASAGDEGAVQVFWADVGSEFNVDSNPVIVPLKVLKGHRVVESLGIDPSERADVGVLEVEWHPRLAWLVSAGADGKAILWT
jgi:ribosome biogenesis protein ERB1